MFDLPPVRLPAHRPARGRLMVTIALATAVLGVESLAANDRAALTAETLWQIQRLSAASISPDGGWALVAVATPDLEKDSTPSDLWMVSTKGEGARQLTSHEASDGAAVWSPDGSRIAFVSKRGDDEAAQLYVISTSGGEARRVTKVPTGVSAPVWFPDGKRVAFISRIFPDAELWDAQGERAKAREKNKVSARVWDRAPIRWWDTWLDERRPHLFAVDVDSAVVEPITLGTGHHLPIIDPGRGHFDIAPNGEEVAFVADIDESGIDSNYDIFRLSLGSKEARTITADNPAGDDSPRYSPDGRVLAFSRQSIKGFYADTDRLVFHDLTSGTNEVKTAGWDRSVSGAVWSADSSALFAAIDDAGSTRLYRIDAASGAPTAITRDHSFSSLDIARDGTLVALRQSFSEPPTLVRIDPATGDVTKLSSFNDELLAKVDFGDYESVSYEGSNGVPIQMWVVYPPGFDRSKKYPLYLLLHGGPHNGITDGFHWRWNAHIFASWGYVTGWHNFHGSSGFGQDFADSINPDRATLPYQDTIAAAEWFAAQPWIDADKMAAGGGSYGGYLASTLLGREHPFKTLVAHAAVYNNYTQYGADYGAGVRRHGAFWESEHDASTSPHLGAGKFVTPTLVIHGQLDYRVPLNHGIELFNTLQGRGVESKLVYYPDENHWVLKPNNSIHWYQTKQDWLKRFLGGS